MSGSEQRITLSVLDRLADGFLQAIGDGWMRGGGDDGDELMRGW